MAFATPAPAQVVDWGTERPPRPLPARDVDFPPYEVRTLPNGLQLLAVAHHEQPVVSVRLLVRAGAAQDPPGKGGLASLAAALLDQGTRSRPAQDIANTIDSIGGLIDTGAGTDLTFLNIVVMKDSFGLAMDLLADMVRQPAFADAEVERQREQVLSGFKVSYEDPDYIAGVVFERLVYGFHPYGMPNPGTPQSVATLTREDLLGFHAAYFRPNNAILAVVGDVSAEEAVAQVERVFGDWARGEVPPVKTIDTPPPTRRLVIVDKPDAVQTEIRVGHVSIPRKHDDYLALNLAVKILGGEGSNRLHRVLRTERNLTYGASADMESLKYAGSIVADTDTRTDVTAEALRLVVDEFWNLQRERVGSRELGDAQAYLEGNFPLTIETPDAIALQVLNAVFYGLDLDELETYRDRVRSVTPDDIQRVAREYLAPDRLSIVLVGNAAAFRDTLRAAGFTELEVVPIAELDLTAVDFRRKQSRIDRPDAGHVQRVTFQTAAPRAAMTPQALLERAIAAKGGLERLRNVRTVSAVASTTIHTAQGPVTAPTRTYIEYPDRFRVEAELPTGRLVQVYADGQAWVSDPTGVRDVPPELQAEFRNSVRRDVIPLLLAVHDGTLRVEAASETQPDLDGVRITGDGLEPVELLLDAGSGLIVVERYASPGPDGPQPTEERFSDFREVGGVQVPFRATVTRGGVPVVERVVTSVEHNVSIDPALFRKPS